MALASFSIAFVVLAFLTTGDAATVSSAAVCDVFKLTNDTGLVDG